MKLVVGISGASGAPYADRVLSFLRDHGEEQGIETHIVLSKMGRVVWNHEIGTDPAEYGMPIWLPGDMTAPMASGSAKFDAMVVVPCSGGSLSRIAHGTSSDLLGRAADVMLKERRKLVLVLRETPLSLVHIRNLEAVTLAGAVVLPAVPSFYSMPATKTELIDTVTSRILDQLGVDNELMRRWTGLHPKESSP
ncbi:MAG: UbiX family flavin prenyltransferase [Deltaproteobacteria bacterium]|nr:MAG: UbiX family flavin prenyltransferase [Deltaproteobacteria bacterium]